MKKIFLGIFLLFGTTFAFEVPENDGYVTDLADIFTQVQEQSLTQKLEQIEQVTTAEVAVLTVLTTGDEEIQRYGTRVAHAWGVGKKDVDNGVLITIAVEDRQWRIDVGYGAEGVLPDIRAKRIGERSFPHYFRQGDYYQGVSIALDDIGGFLRSDESIISQYESEKKRSPEQLILFGVLFFLIIGFVARFNTKSFGWQLFFGALIVIAITVFFYGDELSAWFFGLIFGMFGGGGNGGTNRFSGGFGSSGGSFGGFGGGGFGGGGAGGRW